MGVRRLLAAATGTALVAVGAASVTSFVEQARSGLSPAPHGVRVSALAPGAALPQLVGSLPYGGRVVAGALTDWRRPTLALGAGGPGRVGRAASLYVVDTTTASRPERVRLWVTNLAAAAASLRGFSLPVGLWTVGAGGWRRVGGGTLEAASGRLDLAVAPGRVYVVSLERGGRFLAVGAPVAPSLYLAAA